MTEELGVAEEVPVRKELRKRRGALRKPIQMIKNGIPRIHKYRFYYETFGP
ncbi:hypothetical protein [Bacillus norwichensis]|uniref:Uncharacterized protein n=1 Tax=Bacillus norwichensis TaxID=2762217 RepID=A0ABR8VN39_9BACI|nr:hypothetical protein [Bacillus norwichensis]MBD8006162.1 hypothetical protein [Bacillus norwichensis]